MKKTLWILAALLTISTASAEEIKLTLGRVLSNVTVTSIDPDGIVVTPNRQFATGVKYHWDMLAPDEAARLKTLGEQQAQKNDARLRLESSAVNATGNIVSVAKEGVLARIHVNQGTEEVLCFVYTTQKYVDDESFSGKLYIVGRYQYTSALGAQKTVWAFATSPEDAVKYHQVLAATGH